MVEVGARDAVIPARQVRLVVAALFLAVLLAALDATIVATALPTIAGELGSLGQLGWLVTAYLLAATVCTPLWGRVGDIHGRPRVFELAIVVFLVGSVLVAVAQSLGQAVAFRAIQGIGGGGILSLSRAVLGDVVAPRERGKYQGYQSAVWAVAALAGPLVGGVFVDTLSWRWAFLVNLPLGMVTLAVVHRVLDQPVERLPHRIDWVGAALLSASLATLFLSLTSLGEGRSAGSLAVAGGTMAGLALAAAFLVWQRRVEEPILPVRLFANAEFARSTFLSLLLAATIYQASVFLPLYLQVVQGKSATRSGLLLLPLLLANLVASVVAGLLVTRTGRYKAICVAACFGNLLGGVALVTLSEDTSRATTAAFMVLLGLSNGAAGPLLFLVNQNAVRRRDLGVATATITLFRSLGNTIGVALVGVVLTWSITRELDRADLGGLDAQALRNTPAQIAQLEPGARDAVVRAFEGAISHGFLSVVPLAAGAFLLSLTLRGLPLRETLDDE